MRIDFIHSINEVSQKDWNQLWSTDYPFVRYEFLLALEASGCTTSRTGWEPFHCLAWDGAQLLGVLPLYVKTHSYGEYVFDWSWANAYHQAGYDYYPKLLNAVPFTPATGPRWTVRGSLSAEAQQNVMREMLAATMQRMAQRSLSGLHCLFPSAENVADYKQLPALMQRLDCQFHWFNQGFATFDDFLQTFSSRKRKNLNKERARVKEQGLRVQMTEGAELSSADWEHFYQLYRRTYRKRSGHDGYLNEAFFQQLGREMSGQVVMARAWRDDFWCAAALYLRDSTTLYGRYWGADDDYDALHFECCYYQGVEYAIEQKLQRFDPGAQGEHKIARGFTPILTQSFHCLQQADFASAVHRFLTEERQHVRAYCDAAREQLPFKTDHPLIAKDCLIEFNQPPHRLL
jgi:predicted N-acyltransferase